MMDNMEKNVMMGVEEHQLSNGFLIGQVLSNDSGRTSADYQNSETGTDSEEEETGYPLEFKRRGLLATGCCYDDRMKLHANADFGPNPHYPEDRLRIEEIMKTFKRAGIVYTGLEVELVDIVRRCPTRYMWRMAARKASEEEICLAHHPKHYAWVEELSHKPTHKLRKPTKVMDQSRDGGWRRARPARRRSAWPTTRSTTPWWRSSRTSLTHELRKLTKIMD